MDRNVFLLVIFLLSFVVNVSSVSVGGQSRKLSDAAPKANTTGTNATEKQPSPVSAGKQTEPNSINPAKPGKEKPKDTQVPTNNSSEADSNQKGEVKNGEKTNSELGKYWTCDESIEKCTVLKEEMIACIRSFENGSKVLLVQNKGEHALKVNLSVPASAVDASGEQEIPKHETISINISSTFGKSTKLVVNAGNEECVFANPLISEGNFFQWIPPYSELVTPIYGAYFLFLTALVVGGTWACCKFRKRRHQEGVPYQELEMGLPQSISAVNVETAEGWDQGWDDDWDEDKAVKSPGGQYVGNISANGLTSRSSNKEGWENDWDD